MPGVTEAMFLRVQSLWLHHGAGSQQASRSQAAASRGGRVVVDMCVVVDMRCICLSVSICKVGGEEEATW